MDGNRTATGKERVQARRSAPGRREPRRGYAASEVDEGVGDRRDAVHAGIGARRRDQRNEAEVVGATAGDEASGLLRREVDDDEAVDARILRLAHGGALANREDGIVVAHEENG